MNKPLSNPAVPLYLRVEAADTALLYANAAAAYGPESLEALQQLEALHSVLEDINIWLQADEIAAGE